MFGQHLRAIFMLGFSNDVQRMEQAGFKPHTYQDVAQQTCMDSYQNLSSIVRLYPVMMTYSVSQMLSSERIHNRSRQYAIINNFSSVRIVLVG